MLVILWISLSTATIILVVITSDKFVNFIDSCISNAKSNHGANVWVLQRLKDISVHGKRDVGISNFNKLLTVPKSYFLHMYIVGNISGIVVLYSYFQTVKFKMELSIISLIVYQIQVLRRFLECLYMTKYEKSQIHLFAYLFGIIHYIFVPFTLLESSNQMEVDRIKPSVELILVSLTIFAIASYYQFRCHLILFNMKTVYSTGYLLPNDSLFYYVCCPHYLMEILIYTSFYLLDVTSTSRLFLLLWVISNLSVVANENMIWYKKEFPDEIKVKVSKQYKRLIPFVW